MLTDMFECELPKQYFVTMFKHCNYNTSFQICKKQGDDCEDQSTPLSPRPLTKKKRKNIGCILFVASIAIAIAIPILLLPGTFGFFLFEETIVSLAHASLYISILFRCYYYNSIKTSVIA